MKNIFKIVFVIIGTLIGAGFASGQEMYIFFYSYGVKGIFGIFISSGLMGFIIYKTLNIIDKYGISNYKDFLNIVINIKTKREYLNIKNILNIIINIFILITFFIMIAGFGAYFEQSIGINHFVGSIILATMCFVVLINSVKGLVKINQILIPILILLILLVGIISFLDINLTVLTSQADNNSFKWLISSVLYCSYNSILLIPTLITLKKYIKSKKQIMFISIISSLIIISLSLILFFILSKVEIDLSTLEMPIVYVVSKISAILKVLYGFVIISSIFTTSISLGISFLKNTCRNRKQYPQIAIIMCITAVIVSQFGFSNLVNLLYPIFGYLGIIQIFTMFSK